MRVVAAESVFLILTAISSATLIAGEGAADHCRCVPSQRLALASESPSDSLSIAFTDGQDAREFRWQPAAPERRWVYIVIHHSATDSGSVEAIHNAHRQRRDAQGNRWLGIGYHFVIGNGAGMPDGQIEATFRWTQQIHGAHSGSQVHNAVGVGICLIGNFQETAPSPRQLAAVTDLITQLAARYNIPPRLIIGHNTVKPTACPGKHFPLRDIINKSVGGALPPG